MKFDPIPKIIPESGFVGYGRTRAKARFDPFIESSSDDEIGFSIDRDVRKFR